VSGIGEGWIYFGCKDRPGHYAFGENGYNLPYGHALSRWIGHLDGTLPPQPESAEVLYVAAFSRLGGVGCSALAWWDRSVDKRGACNSAVLAPSLTIEPRAMLLEARERFLWVFGRQPKVRLLDGFVIVDV
jgi:hypothetical protein